LQKGIKQVHKMKKILLLLLLMGLVGANAQADEVKIVGAEAIKKGSTWHFNVTLRHKDTGWDHYADAWRVVTKDGKVLGERTLYHPHVNEQPFTRGLSDVKIPADMERVYIEAHDKVHGWAKEKWTVNLQ
jgi:hypothetical protein